MDFCGYFIMLLIPLEMKLYNTSSNLTSNKIKFFEVQKFFLKNLNESLIASLVNYIMDENENKKIKIIIKIFL